MVLEIYRLYIISYKEKLYEKIYQNIHFFNVTYLDLLFTK